VDQVLLQYAVKRHWTGLGIPMLALHAPAAT